MTATIIDGKAIAQATRAKIAAATAALTKEHGIVPGLGGSVVDWVAYGHVVQTSRDRSQFGRGDNDDIPF